MSAASIALIGLTVVTVVFKGAGAMLTRVPDPLAQRLAGLAPALLAGLVVAELTGPDGLPQAGPALAGVVAALVLTVKRAPLVLCVIAGAAVAAAIRALS